MIISISHLTKWDQFSQLSSGTVSVGRGSCICEICSEIEWPLLVNRITNKKVAARVGRSDEAKQDPQYDDGATPRR